MVAYSFQKRFVEPIRFGLRSPPFCSVELDLWPKRQTIRADRRRHARPDEELQLYCGMRTRQCFLIGRAACIGIRPIVIDLKRETIKLGDLVFAGASLSSFARCDGFSNWMDMRDFWRETHGGDKFSGVLIQWEPLR